MQPYNGTTHSSQASQDSQAQINQIVELSVFQRDNPEGWIKRAERYFRLNPIGATHNFLCTKIIDNLSLQMKKLNGYSIVMGNGNTVAGATICKTLGWIFSNYEKFIMRFMMGGKIHIFKGDPNITKISASKAYMVELHHIHSHRDPNAPNDLEISLKQEFLKIFEVLTRMPHERPIDHTLVQELISTEVIQPSQCLYASPTLLVRKKEVIVLDRYPIPVVDQLLDELYGKSVFSKLDLKSGYYQIRMKKEDIPKTAFKTHNGHYEFKVMPFGLSNATFQSLMNQIFQRQLRYFPLSTNSLHINAKKCRFGESKLEYLGHWVSAEGVEVDKKKISTKTNWLILRNLKELYGFLRLIGYYRKFIANYASIAWPLTQLLRKDAFCWSGEAQAAFSTLKQAMTMALVLALLNFSQEFIVKTDAFGSDQYNLKFLLEPKKIHAKCRKWLVKSTGYSFEIKNKNGKNNQVVGVLSQCPSLLQVELNEAIAHHAIDLEVVRLAVDQDTKLAEIKTSLSKRDTTNELYSLKNGSLLDRERLGRIFLGTFWHELHTLQGAKHKFSSSYHPQTDGQTETLWLHWAEYSYNTSYRSSTKMTPFRTVYGRDLLQLIKHRISPSPLDAIDQLLTEQDAILKILKFNLHKAQVRKKFNIDKHRQEIKSYRMKSLAKKENEKLNPCYFGLYPIMERIGPLTSRPLKTQILVSCKNLLGFESSWMTVSAFLRQFPTSHLVDKVKLMGE
ncbi:unnamed protein product [Spirodela intermedia]|uniref:Reverse transcriptase domain-containing protein n=1 Tax=Spirodela intermedia TaxID=51605 RepID=A0A7I8JLL5_SPIIN|nr:unnamed protein product [Spirodela intermedia]CAA6671066.1 unnamed protein product [Spirodela intermedia]